MTVTKTVDESMISGCPCMVATRLSELKSEPANDALVLTTRALKFEPKLIS